MCSTTEPLHVLATCDYVVLVSMVIYTRHCMQHGMCLTSTAPSHVQDVGIQADSILLVAIYT